MEKANQRDNFGTLLGFKETDIYGSKECSLTKKNEKKYFQIR